MAEQAIETADAGEQNDQTAFDAITSQEELDRIITARLDRERKKFADYDELKSKAARLSEIEEAQKSESQRQQEALEAAQAELADLRAQALRAEVAAEKGVPVALLAGGTREELEAAADALIEFKGQQKGYPLHLPGEGTQPRQDAGGDWLREQLMKN